MPAPYGAMPLDDTHSVVDITGHIQHHDDLAHWLNTMAAARASRLLAATYDGRYSSTASAPTAGVGYLARIQVNRAVTITNIEVAVGTAGTGATALANCFFALYDATTLARLAVTADASTILATNGARVVPLVTPYAFAGTPGSELLIGMCIGTQSTVPLTLYRSSGSSSAIPVNFDKAAGTYNSSTWGTTVTTLPDPAPSQTSGSNLWLFGLS